MNSFPYGNYVIHAIPGFTDNYFWIIQKDHHLAIIDPGDATPILAFIEQHQLQLEAILITHHHCDHIGGVASLKRAYPNCIVFGPKDDRIPYIDVKLSEETNLALEILCLDFQIIHTPGHTLTHICYYDPNHHWLFCGDTLFSAGCGRLFEGTATQMLASLETLKLLPDQTGIFCAHEYTINNLIFAKSLDPSNKALIHYLAQLQAVSKPMSLPSSIKREKAINPFLRSNEPDFIANMDKQYGPFETALSRFTKIRQLKDNF